ncbi:hypothetical protein KEJ34_07930 [Candidatus Bathyarchaeota archaeon]|nr:hypothetical protein [Candidatus Bathyarchaeota archaeon]
MVKPRILRPAASTAACAAIFLLLLSAASFCLSKDAYGVFPEAERSEEALSSAFRAVLEAEASGANISSLLVRLNEAAGLLSEAELLYRFGDHDGAQNMAGQSLTLASSVRDEALALKMLAAEERSRAFQFHLAFSIVGSAVFLVSLFSIWRWFRGFYIRRIMDLKPEVASDAEPR